jgi:hypothetical protein
MGYNEGEISRGEGNTRTGAVKAIGEGLMSFVNRFNGLDTGARYAFVYY